MEEAELFAHLAERVQAGEVPALGIMGGTFDPVHRGHTELVRAAAGELGLDGVLFVPTGVPSFKRDRQLVSGADRLAMVRLAIAGLPRAAASDRELRRPGITYAVDTLRELAAAVPAPTRLVYVVGADALALLPQWRCAAEVAALCEFAVAGRAGLWTVDEARRALDRAGFAARVHGLRAAVPEVSSTALRAQLASGSVAPGLLDPSVLAYLADRGLYGLSPARPL